MNIVTIVFAGNNIVDKLMEKRKHAHAGRPKLGRVTFQTSLDAKVMKDLRSFAKLNAMPKGFVIDKALVEYFAGIHGSV